MKAKEIVKQELIRRIKEDPVHAHHWLCHGDGSKCQDGCDKRANPKRLEFYNSI